MTIAHTIAVAAPRDTVFALFEDLASWPEWDRETAEVFLPDGLRQGSSGWLKPRNGPKARVRVAEVEPGRSFTMEGRLPFCRVYFDHDLLGDDAHTDVTHSVRFRGPLSFLFRRLIGRGIDHSLPDTLRGLKQAAEGRANPA